MNLLEIIVYSIKGLFDGTLELCEGHGCRIRVYLGP